jgi:DNA-binding beta-propeller fold protein YncE
LQGNAILSASGVIYVPDNEPITIPSNSNSFYPTGTYNSQILPFTIGGGGALQAETTGVIPDELPDINPIQLLVESKGNYLYVANQGNNVIGPNQDSGIAAYYINKAPYELTFVTGGPFGSGAGPQCILEDPSNQFIYEANEYDSTITGRVLDPNSGNLDNMRVTSTYSLPGPPTWCLMDGRTG